MVCRAARRRRATATCSRRRSSGSTPSWTSCARGRSTPPSPRTQSCASAWTSGWPPSPPHLRTCPSCLPTRPPPLSRPGPLLTSAFLHPPPLPAAAWTRRCRSCRWPTAGWAPASTRAAASASAPRPRWRPWRRSRRSCRWGCSRRLRQLRQPCRTRLGGGLWKGRFVLGRRWRSPAADPGTYGLSPPRALPPTPSPSHHHHHHPCLHPCRTATPRCFSSWRPPTLPSPTRAAASTRSRMRSCGWRSWPGSRPRSARSGRGSARTAPPPRLHTTGRRRRRCARSSPRAGRRRTRRPGASRRCSSR
jgi:hypothetical protein